MWGFLIGLYIVACVLFVPGSLLTLGAGALFGVGLGTGVVSIGAQNGLGGDPVVFTADQLTLNGGTLKATAAFSIDSNRGVTLLAGGATIDVNPVPTLTLATVITGAGNLTKIGAGILILSAANTYTGKTVINVGTLRISAENNLGGNPAVFVSPQLTINGGTLEATADFSIDDSNRGVAFGLQVFELLTPADRPNTAPKKKIEKESESDSN